MEPTEITSASTLTSTAEDLSPLEQDVLDEYERLAENMKRVSYHWYHEKRQMDIR